MDCERAGTAAVLLTTEDPCNLTTEVADYSSVPPVTQNPNSPVKDVDEISRPEDPSSVWDHGRNGGADFNMEAPILAEDLIRAGGLGSRDELQHFLPSAIDATDYEASLRDAQEYEDVGPERDVPRPGIGFVKDQQNQMDGVKEL